MALSPAMTPPKGPRRTLVITPNNNTGVWKMENWQRYELLMSNLSIRTGNQPTYLARLKCKTPLFSPYKTGKYNYGPLFWNTLTCAFSKARRTCLLCLYSCILSHINKRLLACPPTALHKHDENLSSLVIIWITNTLYSC